MRRYCAFTALAFGVIDLTCRLLFPTDSLAFAPVFFIALLLATISAVWSVLSLIRDHEEWKSSVLTLFASIAVIAYLFGGSFLIQMERRAHWFRTKKLQQYERIAQQCVRDKGGLTARYKWIVDVDGTPVSAKTNHAGYVIVRFDEKRMARGGFLFAETIDALPRNELTVVRKLGDNWYEYMVGSSGIRDQKDGAQKP
jgi:hypothetical protein